MYLKILRVKNFIVYADDGKAEFKAAKDHLTKFLDENIKTVC